MKGKSRGSSILDASGTSCRVSGSGGGQMCAAEEGRSQHKEMRARPGLFTRHMPRSCRAACNKTAQPSQKH